MNNNQNNLNVFGQSPNSQIGTQNNNQPVNNVPNTQNQFIAPNIEPLNQPLNNMQNGIPIITQANQNMISIQEPQQQQQIFSEPQQLMSTPQETIIFTEKKDSKDIEKRNSMLFLIILFAVIAVIMVFGFPYIYKYLKI